MIITRLIGGLGNQMFQYAIGRSLSLHLNTELKIDISGFETYTLHSGYGLNHFLLQPKIATSEEIATLRGSKGIMGDFLRRIRFFYPSYVKEHNLSFNSSLLSLGDNHFLDGYWQSEKYFKLYENALRKDFIFTYPLSPEKQKIKKVIQNNTSVSLHIRRGDYITNAHTNTFHGTCSQEYYQKAVHLIAQKIKAPTFFIFSDDISWCKSNIHLEFSTYFIENEARCLPHEDMYLMSLCSHHIIANSTFSWWGAWLNANPNKIVIAPKQWFANPKIKNPDILPDSWVSI